MKFPWTKEPEEPFVQVGDGSWEDLMDEIEKPKPWYYHLWWELRYRPYHIYTDTRFAVKNWLQRAFRGYADYDVWDHYSQASKRAVATLTELMNNGHGIKGDEQGCSFIQGVSLGGPEDEGAREPWKAKLRDMIWFHTVAAGLPIPKELQREKTYKTRRGERSYTMTHYDHNELLPEEKERYDRGKKLYMDFYESLWD